MADSEKTSGKWRNDLIIKKWQSGNYDIPALAKMFGISERLVWVILDQSNAAISLSQKSFVARILARIKKSVPRLRTEWREMMIVRSGVHVNGSRYYSKHPLFHAGRRIVVAVPVNHDPAKCLRGLIGDDEIELTPIPRCQHPSKVFPV